jgi:hypothetical protein
MKKLWLFGLTLLALIMTPSVVSAAKASADPSEPVGYDISWPQCGKQLPSGQAFGIVGVNGGNAATTNPCLATQLQWAIKSKGTSAQPKIQLYVNTANPGEVKTTITTWPANNTDKTTGQPTNNPYGMCNGDNDLACSWQYGWNRSIEASLDRFAPAARTAGISPLVSSYIWWLDVETMNTWQSGSNDALARNSAALEAMASYYQSKGATVGLYSTSAQWATITGGTVGNSGPLKGLANWRPSGTSLKNAIANCSVAPLTPGGSIALTQYIQQGFDRNHSCL